MAQAMAATRVVKRLGPHQSGAQRWARRYGDALVCVRYRVDADGQRRYTTVELLVDEAPTIASRRDAVVVGVRISHLESELRRGLIQVGAQWDSATNLWRMSRGQVKALGLTNRVVKE